MSTEDLSVQVKCPESHCEWLNQQREVAVWLREHAKGKVTMSNKYLHSKDIWADVYTFTDADTAFWFKVYFQG